MLYLYYKKDCAFRTAKIITKGAVLFLFPINDGTI